MPVFRPATSSVTVLLVKPSEVYQGMALYRIQSTMFIAQPFQVTILVKRKARTTQLSAG